MIKQSQEGVVTSVTVNERLMKKQNQTKFCSDVAGLSGNKVPQLNIVKASLVTPSVRVLSVALLTFIFMLGVSPQSYAQLPGGTVQDLDGDGVNNDDDLDDDNDGVLDKYEVLASCDTGALDNNLNWESWSVPPSGGEIHETLPMSTSGSFDIVDEYGIPTQSSATGTANGSGKGSFPLSPGGTGVADTGQMDIVRVDGVTLK